MARQITITIDTGNAAFDGGNAGAEVARILRKTAERIAAAGIKRCDGIAVLDINGNTVGRVTVADDNNGDVCDECELMIPASALDMINIHHSNNCSLHPINIERRG
jgi:hypothetical protein